MKVSMRPSTLFLPKPVALITSAAGGRDNVMAAAWVNAACMEPPMLSVSVRSSRFTHELIGRSEQFAVNLPGEELLAAVEVCGSVSGRDCDKFERAGIGREAASRIEAPLVAECFLNAECRVAEALELGSHTLFVGEVLALRLDRRVAEDGGYLKADRARPFVLNHREYWSMGERIGTFGSGAPPFRIIP